MRFSIKNFFRKSLIKNKKGISPLIATVLLIGFTVALAAVVITWGSGFVQRVTEGTDKRTTESLACTGDLNFEISKVTCGTGGGNGTVLVDNKGSINIINIALRTFNTNGDNLGSTKIGEVNSFEIKTKTSVIQIGTSKVEAFATIVIDGNSVTCTDATRTKTFSPAC